MCPRCGALTLARVVVRYSWRTRLRACDVRLGLNPYTTCRVFEGGFTYSVEGGESRNMPSPLTCGQTEAGVKLRTQKCSLELRGGFGSKLRILGSSNSVCDQMPCTTTCVPNAAWCPSSHSLSLHVTEGTQAGLVGVGGGDKHKKIKGVEITRL
ncbi:hypothetical protein BDY19DRAFT_429144 [Irpex rosettiformis]|uniref:Uncharacterized protein n=1 Tax=Irpex rosettiformis TaxID=378272 RepID=A0ACB8UGL2_9APHY|nr:hypothetical protein BDY19DRAFT_429144 [Irpex rosettiformis]